MATWNQGGGYPPGNPGYYQDPNQGYYGPPPGGYPPPGGAPYSGYPPNQGYPPPAGGYPPNPGFGGGFVPPPQGVPYGHVPPNQPFNPAPQPAMYGGYADTDPEGMKGFDFSDQSIRRGFIRKVYSILLVQLSLTLGVIALFLYHEGTRKFVGSHPEIWWIALVVMFVTLIGMACCGNVRRKAPMNFIFLALFTGAESFMLAAAAATYKSEEVIMAVGFTAVICLGLTLFAFQTKWDFTVMGGVLFVAVLLLMVFGIVAIFFPGKTIKLIYGSIGALIFSIYLIYDTQLMMGGKHKYSISPEEYIFAALNLYMDIINIFLYILTIIGASRD